MRDRLKIPVIAGPTSSGKTSLALKICKKIGGEIISADSRQVYKYMDIGTGKVPLNSEIAVEKRELSWQFDGITIWGYDLAVPGEHFSVKEYADFALTKAKSLIEQGKIPVITGGTGFYIDVITKRTEIAGIEPDLKLRTELKKLSLKKLQKKLMSLNPEAYNDLDQNNPVRIIRAIEIELGGKNSPTPLPYLESAEFNFIGLDAKRKILYSRADNWLEVIWGNGLINEVSSLIDMGFKNSPELEGIVYKTVVEYLEGDLTDNKARERIKFDLHAYIRRQLTWFKRNKEIAWLDLTDPVLVDQALNLVESN